MKNAAQWGSDSLMQTMTYLSCFVHNSDVVEPSPRNSKGWSTFIQVNASPAFNRRISKPVPELLAEQHQLWLAGRVAGRYPLACIKTAVGCLMIAQWGWDWSWRTFWRPRTCHCNNSGMSLSYDAIQKLPFLKKALPQGTLSNAA